MSGSSARAEARARWKIPATASLVIANPALPVMGPKQEKPPLILFWAAVPFAVMDMWLGTMIRSARLIGGQRC
jgi:hypothetical protein